MDELPQESHFQGAWKQIRILMCGFLLLVMPACRAAHRTTAKSTETVLRVGVARIGSASTVTGLRPIVQNLTEEGLLRINETGHTEGRLARSWTVSPDGLSMTIRLRSGIKFHDASPLSAESVVNILNDALPRYVGPAFADVDHLTAIGSDLIEVRFRRPSPLLREALDVPIRKSAGSVSATGPFSAVDPNSFNELRANRSYYLGSPSVDRIVLKNYPTVRAAWADMLRDEVDMLYEISSDALGFMSAAQNVAVFTFPRNYQYVMVLNVRSPKLRSPAIRRALNLAIDRAAVVRDALDGHGSASFGLVSPNHWAFGGYSQDATFDPALAASILSAQRTQDPGGQLRFTCLVPPDYERIALVVKQQLEAVGVFMDLQEVSADGAARALSTPAFEAVLTDIVSGPSIFRTYQVWHSAGPLNIGALGNAAIDHAFDGIRHTTSDDEYRNTVAALQRVTREDPPAIFLAWGERARAVSRRFNVPAEPGRDVLTTLRLWRPTTDERLASRN